MSPLRIVVPIHSFEPGGVERVALNLAVQWQEAGHDVVVVLGRDEGLDRANAPRSLTYRTIASFIPTARFETIWMMWSLLRYLAGNRADVIFCPGNTYTVVCIVMKILFGDRCPPVVAKVSNDLVRADQPRAGRMWYRLWLRINGLFLERFVGLAEPMFGEIVAGMGVGEGRVSIIHDPALSQDRFARLAAIVREPTERRPSRFLAIGRLEPQKNFAMLLLAFAAGFRPGDSLTIVGAGSLRAALDRIVRRMALEDQVRFAGHVPSPDAFLAEADCLLLSSNYEGVPAVVIEAMAAGVPVIATDCCASMGALLGRGVRGMLVPVGDVHAFADAITHSARLPVPSAFDRAYASRFVLEHAAGAYVAVMRQEIEIARHIRRLTLPEMAR